MMQWFHTHHLLAGALFRGEHHHHHRAADAGQGQPPQPQQWLAAGMEIVAGMMTAAGGGDGIAAAADSSCCSVASPVGTTDGPVDTTSLPPPDATEDLHSIAVVVGAGVSVLVPTPARPSSSSDRLPSRRTPSDANGVDEDEDEDDSVPLLPRSATEEEREGLRQEQRLDHPLALRRSASSAFGSPSSLSLCDYGGIRGRTQSYSGHSDPGTATTSTSTTSTSTSAFHAWG